MPNVDEYMKLRKESGLTPMSREQSEAATQGAWYACYFKLSDGEAVAMGRVIGDGAWYYVIADIATLPQHQGQGLGSSIVKTLLQYIYDTALPNPYITLMADPPGVNLYKKFGFEPSARSIGMVKKN